MRAPRFRRRPAVEGGDAGQGHAGANEEREERSGKIGKIEIHIRPKPNNDVILGEGTLQQLALTVSYYRIRGASDVDDLPFRGACRGRRGRVAVPTQSHSRSPDGWLGGVLQ